LRGKPAFWLRLKRRLTGTDEDKTSSIILRMAMVIAFLVVGFGWVLGQSSIYQVTQGAILSHRGEKRARRSHVMTGRRGQILDRTGSGVLALTVPSPKVEFTGAPYYVDRAELGFSLAEALGLDADRVINRIMAEERYALIKRNVSDEEVATIRKLGLRGVTIGYENRRFYPMEEVLGAELGFVQDKKGNRGLEAQYDRALQGGTKRVKVLRDAHRRGLFEGGADQPWALNGNDLVLTIDSRIQIGLESELSRRVETERAVGGMAVVLDPHTFEVLAMASVPSMDPNRHGDVCAEFETKDAGADIGFNPCRNKVITYPFEPGSVAKIFTAAAAFDSGKLGPSTMVDGQGGRCRIGKHWVHDLERLDRVPIRDAIKFSSNCAMAEVGERTGMKQFVRTLRRFGFGRPTGIDLPNETAGEFKPQKAWAQTWLKTAAYGYGFRASLLQLAVGAATIANDGVRLKPRIARETRSPDGRVVERFDAGKPIRVVSRAAARKVLRTMISVVMDEDGTGVKARPIGYTAAGKTGTARMAWLASHGRGNAYMTSFVGFAPAREPRIVVAVAIIDPREDRFGGSAAGPVFAAVVTRTLETMGVAHDRSIEPESDRLADGF